MTGYLRKIYKNVLIEINNECNIEYDHDILKPDRVHELIELVQEKERKTDTDFMPEQVMEAVFIPTQML